MKTRKTMFLRTSLLVLLLLAATTPHLAVAGASGKDRCHPNDNAALIAIKAAFGNPYYFASWTPDYPCCRWYDVDCDTDGRVVGLSVFQDANVTGPIPDAIAGLTHLQNLLWHHLPALSGPIPRAIAKLSRLSQLTISNTAVSGPVPSFLGALTNLAFLDLSFNSLTGAIPASLAALPGLSAINLSRNRLNGTVPPLLLSKASGEAYLVLSHNNLSDSIPAEFAAVNFVHVDLSRNAFTGDASGLFGRVRDLQYLDLSRNTLSFNLSDVELPENIYFTDMSHNAIYGGIPAQVANLTNLHFFNVSYNRLCGAVPTGGNMASMDAYSYQHNKCLCGAPLSNPCK